MDLVSHSRKNKRKPDITFKRIQAPDENLNVVAATSLEDEDDCPPAKSPRLAEPFIANPTIHTAEDRSPADSLPASIGPSDKVAPPYECRFCNFTSSDKTGFLKHTMEHSQSKQLIRCPSCSFTTRLPNSFQHHLSSKHNVHFPNDSAPSPFNPLTEIKCSLCSSSFNDLVHWSKHMFDFHKCAAPVPPQMQFSPIAPLLLSPLASIPLSLPQTADNIFAPYTPVSAAAAPNHEPLNLSRDSPVDASLPLDLSHGSLPEKTPEKDLFSPNDPLPLTEKRYSCPYCDRNYKYSGDLNVHLRRSHKINASKVMKKSLGLDADGRVIQQNIPMMESYKCSYCPFQATWKSEYDKHLQTHVQAKPFRCLFCDYGSRWRCDCKNHMRKHHKDKYFDNPQILNDCMRRVNKNARVFQQMKPTAETVSPFPMSMATPTKREPAVATTTAPALPPQNVSRPLPEFKGDISPDDEEAPHLEIDQSQEPPPSTHTAPVFPGEQYHSLEEQVKKLAESYTKAFAPLDLTSFPALTSPFATGLVPPLPIATSKPSIKPRWTMADLIPQKSSDDFYYCPRCQYKSRTLDKIEVHVASHSDLKIFKCSTCGKRANWKWDVRKHIETKHGGVGDIITLDVTTAQKTLQRYLQSEEHILRYARKNQSSPEKTAKTTNGQFLCGICSRSSNSRWEILRHARYMHPLQTARVVQRSKEDIDTKPHPDSTIGKGKNALSKWRSRLGIKIHKCPVCPYRSNWYSDVFRHIRLQHVGVKAGVVIMDEDEAERSLSDYEHWHTKRKQARSRPTLHGTDGAKYPPVFDDEIRGWRCTVCKFHHRNKHVVNLHSLTHREMAYKCAFCFYSSNHKSSVYRHGTLKHPFEYHSSKHPTKCILNNPNYEAVQETLDDPALRPRRPQFTVQYQCVLCFYKTKLFRSAFRHLRIAHSARSPGHLMHKKFIHSIWLDQPPKEQSDPKSQALAIYQCKLCDFRSKLKKPMVDHYRVHGHDLRSQNLLAHEIASLPNWRTKYRCPNCPFVAAYRPYLNRHLEFHNANAAFKCRFCDYSATLKRILSKHEKLHTRSDSSATLSGNQASSSSSSTAPHEDSASIKCPYCQLQFTNGSDLFDHTKTCHPHDDSSSSGSNNGQTSPFYDSNENIVVKHQQQYKKYACSKCPYRAVSMQMLERHENLHGSGQMYHCQHCDYSVSKRHLIVKHENIHFQPVENNISRSTVRSTTSMLQETKKQTINENEMIFKRCPHCPFVALTSQTLTSHLQYHGGNFELKCFTCNFCVPQADWLADHMALHLLADCSSNAFLSSAVKEKLPSRPNNSESATKLSSTHSSD